MTILIIIKRTFIKEYFLQTYLNKFIQKHNQSLLKLKLFKYFVCNKNSNHVTLEVKKYKITFSLHLHLVNSAVRLLLKIFRN